MYVYVVLSDHLEDPILVEVYNDYNDAFNEAERLMLLEIKRVYGNASVDEEGIKFQDYPDMLHDNNSIAIDSMYIEISRKEVH